MSEYVQVPDEAVEWLKKHYPALCIKAGLCERIAGRLYTRTTTKPAQQDAPTDAELEALAKRHIARGAEQLRAINPDLPPYQQTEQFRRVKAFAVALLARYAPAQAAERERDVLRHQLGYEIAKNDRLLKILVGIHNVTMPPPVEANGTRYQFTPPDAVEWLYRLTERIKAIPEEIDAARAQRAAEQEKE